MTKIDNARRLRKLLMGVISAATLFTIPQAHSDTTFHQPWSAKHRALVLDGYENNEIDLVKVATDKRIAGFIHKGSDGLPPVYGCKATNNNTEAELCKKNWKVYAVSKELYHTRRALAKALGLKWGTYHLARANNPIDQANHLIDFADPQPDELIALDIESLDPQFMSLKDAEEFVRHIKRRLNRYPLIYVNGSVAKHIADKRADYPLLSRLQLWYARYTPTIGDHFPKGNWDQYALWQFSSNINCNKNACPYRVSGANDDIDVNVVDMDIKALKKAWPLGGLVDIKDPTSSVDFSKFLVASLVNFTPQMSALKLQANLVLEKLNQKTNVVMAAKFSVQASSIQGIDKIKTASIALPAWEYGSTR